MKRLLLLLSLASLTSILGQEGSRPLDRKPTVEGFFDMAARQEVARKVRLQEAGKAYQGEEDPKRRLALVMQLVEDSIIASHRCGIEELRDFFGKDFQWKDSVSEETSAKDITSWAVVNFFKAPQVEKAPVPARGSLPEGEFQPPQIPAAPARWYILMSFDKAQRLAGLRIQYGSPKDYGFTH